MFRSLDLVSRAGHEARRDKADTNANDDMRREFNQMSE